MTAWLQVILRPLLELSPGTITALCKRYSDGKKVRLHSPSPALPPVCLLLTLRSKVFMCADLIFINVSPEYSVHFTWGDFNWGQSSHINPCLLIVDLEIFIRQDFTWGQSSHINPCLLIVDLEIFIRQDFTWGQRSPCVPGWIIIKFSPDYSAFYMGRFYVRSKFTHKSLPADCVSRCILHGEILRENFDLT